MENVKKICKERFSSLFPVLYTTLACFIGADPPAHSIAISNKTEKFGFVPNYKGTKICPAKIALDCLRRFLLNIDCEKVQHTLIFIFIVYKKVIWTIYLKAAICCDECTELETGDNLKSFLYMVSQLVEVLSKDYPQYTAKTVSSLNSYSRAPLLAQRIAVVAFFNYMMEYRSVK